MHVFINSCSCLCPTVMILFLQVCAFSNETKHLAFDADVTEDVNLHALDNTGTYLNMTDLHGYVSIGVQAGIPSSGTCNFKFKQRDNKAETRGTDANELTFSFAGKICHGVSVGVNAGQQVSAKFDMGSFFEGGELMSITIH